MRELINEQLVTKGYLDMRIKELELKLTQQIKELELKIESTKAETIKWVAAMLVAQAALIASMVKLIH
ncbi:MAG: DUF1640 domain-containing protein [Nitrospirae bacterium]|nr:DUF1640 domain-containing protein [Nitrospirota bacterium]MBF0540274.1 DUF1640 domain-containing protein [Nitrospirota bacterium]